MVAMHRWCPGTRPPFASRSNFCARVDRPLGRVPLPDLPCFALLCPALLSDRVRAGRLFLCPPTCRSVSNPQAGGGCEYVLDQGSEVKSTASAGCGDTKVASYTSVLVNPLSYSRLLLAKQVGWAAEYIVLYTPAWSWDEDLR